MNRVDTDQITDKTQTVDDNNNADKYSQVKREDTGTRKEYENNMHRTYAYKNRGLEIKINTMEILYEQLKKLEEDLQGLHDEKAYRTLEIMAKLGKAILPD
ncbi:hypothetical protein AN1V17_47020 [Vallitalea sediminicola]